MKPFATLHAAVLLAILLLLLPLTINAQQGNPKLAAEVKAEFLHAWNGYKQYAWGHDDLKPLSKSYHDWYPQPLLMTAVDSLDTMIIMGIDDEVASTKQYILENLSFDKDIEVQNFEITIRLLGGLLTSYQLTNDKRFLDLAEAVHLVEYLKQHGRLLSAFLDERIAEFQIRGERWGVELREIRLETLRECFGARELGDVRAQARGNCRRNSRSGVRFGG